MHFSNTAIADLGDQIQPGCLWPLTWVSYLSRYYRELSALVMGDTKGIRTDSRSDFAAC